MCGVVFAATPIQISAKDRSVVTEEDRQFWSFRPVTKPAVPHADDPWLRSPLDGFVLDQIRVAGLVPAPETTKALWLRRVSFDLIGLPPTPAETAAFEADSSAEAYESVVDRLLASRHYGERWASHWLDGVRYVEEVGYYNFGNLGWRYRDWVINALNEDLPYDQFVVNQIAGDLIGAPKGSKAFTDGIIATGFLCMGNFDCQDSEKDRLYSDVIDDQIDVVTRQFLGLTVACARCHDHKFDPIPTKDYYALGGIFLSTQILGTESRIGAKRLRIDIGGHEDPKRKEEREQEKRRIQEKLKTLNPEDAAEKAESENLNNLLKRLNGQGGVAMAVKEGGYPSLVVPSWDEAFSNHHRNKDVYPFVLRHLELGKRAGAMTELNHCSPFSEGEYGAYVRAAMKYLDIAMPAPRLSSNPAKTSGYNATLPQLVQAFGKEGISTYSYSLSGQAGGVHPDLNIARFCAGFFFHSSIGKGVQGNFDYIYFRVEQDPYNPLAGRHWSHERFWFFPPQPETSRLGGRAITMAAKREGYDDLRYIHTLNKLIKQGQATADMPKKSRAARRAAAKRDRILDSLKFSDDILDSNVRLLRSRWDKVVAEKGKDSTISGSLRLGIGWDHSDYNSNRWAIAQEIIKLQEALR